MNKRVLVAIAFLTLLLPVSVWAKEMSNAELYKLLTAMGKKLDAAVEKIDKVEAEANKAKAEAAVAKSEAAKAKRELARVKASQTLASESRESSGDGLTQRKKSEPGATASLGLVYMRPSRENLDYVVVDTEQTNVIRGTYKSVNPSYEPGVRLNIGYDFGAGVDLGAQYTHLSFKDKLSETNNGGAVDLWGTWLHANSIIDDNNVTDARASYDLDYDVFDFTAGKSYGNKNDLNYRLDAGLRYAHINQGFDIDYVQDLGGGINRRAEIESSNSFRGFGPKVGLGVNWLAGNGFTLFGSVSGSVLVGDFDIKLKQNDWNVGDINPTVRVNIDSTNENRVVPVVEMLAGVSYSRELNNGVLLGGQFGYEWQNWFNMVTTRQFVDDVDNQLSNTDTTDLGFDGFFLKGYIKY